MNHFIQKALLDRIGELEDVEDAQRLRREPERPLAEVRAKVNPDGGQGTRILVSDETCAAARELAHRHGCSTSEAIRRSVLHHWEAVMGASRERRRERVQALHHLFRLFEGHDAEDEVRRLKEQDEGF